ncbi:hypothetical protein Tco_1326039 [Tanacetum coccineum]
MQIDTFESLRDAQDNASGGVSGLGLWDEDNTCWTESFPVSSSSYAKSLSGRVLMWDLTCFFGRGTV